MLDLAHIPFYAKDRDESWPLIVAGGPCACNSEPIADFFDVIQLGEGENQLPGICAEIEKAKKRGRRSQKGTAAAHRENPRHLYPGLL